MQELTIAFNIILIIDALFILVFIASVISFLQILFSDKESEQND